MSICNLFKTLSNTTGNFLTFSQYMEDLTKHNSMGYKYKVTPNKFIACNLNYNALGSNLNDKVPTFFQNYFENGCAIAKNADNWNPSISKNIFWNSLISNGLLSGEGKELLYIGDINMISYDVKDGMGYSEIYVYIPSNASKNEYVCNYNVLTDKFTSNSTLEGYNINIPSINYWSSDSFEITNDFVASSDSKFDINSIIVLYEVSSMDENGNYKTLYSDIPMGIYLPGNFSGKEMNNIITKYVSSEDIYGAGTSYGVRICSRFLATAVDGIVNTEIETGSYPAELSLLMSKMGENLALMNEIAKANESNITNTGALKETYNIFQNYKANVPYIVELIDGNYWFVNGKNTGVRIPDGKIYKEIPENELESIIEDINIIYNADLVSYCSDENGNDVIDNFEVGNTDKHYISTYVVDANGSVIQMDNLEVNGKIVNCKQVNNIKVYEVDTNKNYEVRGIIDNKYIPEVPEVISTELYYPIYYGVGAGDVSSIKSMNKFISSSIYNRINFKPNKYVDGNENKLIYCYPKYLMGGEIGLSHIINKNSMDDIIDDFQVKTVFIQPNDNVPEREYVLYITNKNISSLTSDTIIDFTNILKTINRSKLN